MLLRRESRRLVMYQPAATNRTLAILLVCCRLVHQGCCARLDPGPGQLLHLAGQSPYEFGNYSAYVDSNKSQQSNTSRPMAYSFYRGLIEFQNNSDSQNAAYWSNVEQLLTRLGSGSRGQQYTIIPHLAVHLAWHDGTQYAELNKRTLDEIANTDKYQKSIDALALGLGKQLSVRPVFLRLGYEFNGPWNNYQPAANYKKVWRKIHQALLAQPGLRERVALVWDATCNVQMTLDQWNEWYPGDDIVDWWGVNVLATGNPWFAEVCNGFNPKHPTNSIGLHTMSRFMDAAQRKGFPVLLAEVMTRGVGTRLAQSWDAWFVPFFRDVVASHPAVKGFSYINRLNPVTASCDSVSGFGSDGCDGRIEAAASYVATNYLHLLRTNNLVGVGMLNRIFVHAKTSVSSTCQVLGLDAKDCMKRIS